MEIFQKNKKVFLFVGIFAVVTILYWLFFSGDSNAPRDAFYDPTAEGLISEFSISPADAIVGQELLAMLSTLQSISLDASIFGDPSFVSLQDKSRSISEQPFGKALGRRNPFSDFGKGVLATSTASSRGALPRGTLPSNAFGAPRSE